MTKKLVYEATNVSVKLNDIINVENFGESTVKNIRAPRKESGTGRVTIELTDGRRIDVVPGDINAIWQ